MGDWIDLHALGQILLIGLICGAGLPAVFALGLRALNAGPRGGGTADRDTDQIVGGSPIGMVGATVCFAIVLAAVGWGIYLIVAGT